MPFRLFWHPGQPWSWYRDTSDSLAKYVQRAGGIDCYAALNSWAKPEQGTPCNYDFGLDFDSSDIRESAADANRVAEYLAAMACPFRTYFSGSKGIHIIVPHEVHGVPARVDGGHVCKLFQEGLKKALRLNTLDTGIHGLSRQFRVPNTANSKGGLYKVPLTPAQLTQLVNDGIDAARTLAAAPVPDIEIPLAVSETLRDRLQPYCQRADDENRKRTELQAQRLDVTLNTLPTCIKQLLNEPQRVVQQAKSWCKKTPNRNQLTFVAATFLKCHGGASEADALNVLGPVWQGRVAAIASSAPLEIQRSTETCIRTVFRSEYRFSCGLAISHGCACHPRCPLYIPLADAVKNSGRKPEKG